MITNTLSIAFKFKDKGETSSNKENIDKAVNGVPEKTAEAWTPAVEKKLDSLSLSNKAPPTYHIDLSKSIE